MDEPLGYTEIPEAVKQGALAARQLYLAMIEAGFTRAEAFEITKEILTKMAGTQ